MRYVLNSAVITDYGVWEYAPCTLEQALAWLGAGPFLSAVITDYGVWEYAPCTPEQALAWLGAGPFLSCVGYEETARALQLLTDVSIPCTRRTVRMTADDDALVFRLVFPAGYRPDPAAKGAMSVDFVFANHELGLLKRLA